MTPKNIATKKGDDKSAVVQTFTSIGCTVAEITVPGHKERKRRRISADLMSEKRHTGIAFAG